LEETVGVEIECRRVESWRRTAERIVAHGDPGQFGEQAKIGKQSRQVVLMQKELGEVSQSRQARVHGAGEFGGRQPNDLDIAQATDFRRDRAHKVIVIAIDDFQKTCQADFSRKRADKVVAKQLEVRESREAENLCWNRATDRVLAQRYFSEIRKLSQRTAQRAAEITLAHTQRAHANVFNT
jgi:hypothetical protein